MSKLPLAIFAPVVLFFAMRLVQYALLRARGEKISIDRYASLYNGSPVLAQRVQKGFFWATEPLVHVLGKSRITPNVLSILCLIFSLTGAVVIGFGDLSMGGAIGLLGSSLDHFDGRLARSLGRESKAGSFLDSTLDRCSDLALASGAAIFFRHELWLLVACLVGLGSSAVIPYTRAKAESLGGSLKTGLMQRPERVLLFCSGALLSPVIDTALPAALQGLSLTFSTTVVLLACLTSFTALQRVVTGFRSLRSAE
jgi:phosphatidylglycerophosphate synthase